MNSCFCVEVDPSLTIQKKTRDKEPMIVLYPYKCVKRGTIVRFETSKICTTLNHKVHNAYIEQASCNYKHNSKIKSTTSTRYKESQATTNS